MRLEYLLSGADDRSSLFEHRYIHFTLFYKNTQKDKPIGGCNLIKIQIINGSKLSVRKMSNEELAVSQKRANKQLTTHYSALTVK